METLNHEKANLNEEKGSIKTLSLDKADLCGEKAKQQHAIENLNQENANVLQAIDKAAGLLVPYKRRCSN